MIKVGIIGITGYTGFELLKIFYSHKDADVEYIASRSQEGKNIAQIYPQLSSLLSIKIEKIDLDRIKELDAVFLALPHTVSMEIADKIYGYSRIIDLSADFRLSDVDVYEKWYKSKHKAKKLIEKAVYGLSEINKDKIRNAQLVANPGCYATSVIIPLLPVINIIDINSIISDSKSGTSGAGRGLKEGLQFCEVNENFKAYSVAKHRHTPEIEEFLSSFSNKHIQLTFTPHLLPMQRGMLSTIYVTLNESMDKDSIFDLYDKFYKNSPFVRIRRELPAINDVKGTNFCDIGFEVDKRNNRLIIISVIDNLIKGASGQAVQNMNIMFNVNETEGLLPYPFYP